jgi:hypothetical protein
MDATIYDCGRRGERPRNRDEPTDWAVGVVVAVAVVMTRGKVRAAGVSITRKTLVVKVIAAGQQVQTGPQE